MNAERSPSVTELVGCAADGGGSEAIASASSSLRL